MSTPVLTDLDFGGVARGVNHPDPANPQDVATKAYVDSAPTPGWDESLAVNPSAGANNPVIPTGQYLGFGASPPTNGGSEGIRSDGSLFLYTNSRLNLDAANRIDLKSAIGVLSTAPFVTLSASSSNIFLNASSGVVAINSLMRLIERAAAGVTLAAGQALLWVKDDTPNNPYFTDDTNTDRKIVTAPVPLADMATISPGRTIGLQVDAPAAAVPVPLTGAELTESMRRDTIQTIVDADITPGTPFDVTLNNDTTVLLVRVNGRQQLRTIRDNSGFGGREIDIEYDPTTPPGTLEILHNTAGVIGGSAFFNPNAQSTFVNRTTPFRTRLRSGFWRPHVPVITPWNVSRENAPVGVTSFVRVAVDFTTLLGFAAGVAGVADDVEIYNANAPFSFVIKDLFVICTAGAGTVQLRTATGGLGASVSSVLTLASGTTTRENRGSNMPSRALNDSLYMRRSDGALAGQLVMTCYRF
jgi:hypothetical protein